MSTNRFWRRFEREVLFKSKLYVYLLSRIINRNIRSEKAEFMRFVNKYMDAPAGNLKNGPFYNNFLQILKLQEKYDFKLMVCLHPNLLFGEHPNNKVFAGIMESQRVPYFRMFEYYKKEQIPPESIQVEKKDIIHPNELGHLIIAKAMVNELKKMAFSIEPRRNKP